MSSYHSSFSYLNKNSKNDFGWLIVHFDADNGEMESYLSQDQVYSDTYKGTRRILYGTKWNSVTLIRITVIKQNGKEFSELECRNAYKLLTGNPKANWLDLYVGNRLQCSFLGTMQDIKPQKLDARTVGLNIYFESISPWAYSPQQFVSCQFGQALTMDDDVLTKSGAALTVNNDGVLSAGNAVLSVTTDNVAYLGNSAYVQIDNQSDDLYSYVNLDTTFTNDDSSYVSIKNVTLGEETTITNLSKNEVITLTEEQFIMSDVPYKIFGDTFNFVWPRLGPGVNEFIIGGPGKGTVEFTYRYPMKIGDCAIDTDVSGSEIDCGCPDSSGDSGTISGPVAWNDITNKPTTIKGYGITDAYTMTEVDSKLNNIDVDVDTDIDEDELNAMLSEVLGE